MKWIKILTYNVVILVILFLLVDFLYTRINPLPVRQQDYAISHPDFHHTLKPSYIHVDDFRGEMCTDKNAFRTHCDNLNRSSLSFDVVFIGDSFTQGELLPYENTFVGMYDLAHPDIDVGNLEVVSYSPTRYLQKISYYLDKGLKTKHVVVFIDYNDFLDEDRINRYERNKLVFLIHNYFRYTRKIVYSTYNDIVINDICRDQTAYHPDCLNQYIKTQLQYEGEYQHYRSSGAIERSLSKMEELYKLLNKHGIKLSVGVFPRPKHLKYDNKDKCLC